MRLDVEPEVRSSGILSFAVLVQNVCNNSCTKELLDRYTKHFLDKFSGKLSLTIYEYHFWVLHMSENDGFLNRKFNLQIRQTMKIKWCICKVSAICRTRELLTI